MLPEVSDSSVLSKGDVIVICMDDVRLYCCLDDDDNDDDDDSVKL